MKKILFFPLFALILSTFSQAQDAVPLIAYWQKNEVKKFEILKVRYEEREGVVSRNDSSWQMVTLTVTDSTEDGYVLSWKVELENSEELKAKVGQSFSMDGSWTSLLNGYTLELATSETGEFLDWINWESYRDMMYSFMDEMTAQMGTGNGKVDTKALITQLKPMFATKEQLTSIALQEVQLLFGYHGYEWELESVFEYDEKLPNLMGGEPIDAKGKMKFYDLDEDNATCKMHNEVQVKEDAVKLFVKTFVQKITADQDLDEAEIQKMMDEMDMDIQQKFDYAFDLEWGWVTDFSFEKIVEMKLDGETATRLDHTVIRMVE